MARIPIYNKLTNNISKRAELQTYLGSNPFTSTTELNAYNDTELKLGDSTTIIGDGRYEVTSLGPIVWTRTATDAVGRAEAAADELQSVVDATTYYEPERLFIWRDADSNVVGSVKTATAGWDILLERLQSADGMSMYAYDMVGNPPAFVVVDANDNIIFNSDDIDSATTDEVNVARGSRSNLNDRISQSFDAYGSPLDEFNHNRMRRYHMLRQKRLLGEAARNIVGLFGDSWTHARTRWSGDFAAVLMAEQGDGGGGWTGFGFITGSPAGPYVHGGTQPSFTNGNVRSTYGVSHNGNWTGAYATVPSPDTCCAISSTAGDEIRATFPASPTLSGVDFFWIGTAAGVMEYSWDGTSWTTINVQGTVGACSFASLAGVPGSGSGTLRLRVVSGECRPAGVNWKSVASGVVVHKLAATGSAMAQLATQAAVASWRTAVAALGVNSVTLMHGTNDQGAGATPATFGSNGDTVVTGLRAAVPGVDILWAMPAENQRTSNAFPMPDYKSAASEKAATANVSFIDTQRNFGDPYAPLEYGSSGAFPLFNADLIHPEPSTGGRALLSAFLSFLHR